MADTFRERLLAQLAAAADQSRLAPNRQPGQVRIQGAETPPMKGLFGGGQPTTQADLDRYMPVPIVGIGPNAPAPRQFEDGAWYVPGSESDPVLKLLQDWINRNRPNGD